MPAGGGLGLPEHMSHRGSFVGREGVSTSPGYKIHPAGVPIRMGHAQATRKALDLKGIGSNHDPGVLAHNRGLCIPGLLLDWFLTGPPRQNVPKGLPEEPPIRMLAPTRPLGKMWARGRECCFRSDIRPGIASKVCLTMPRDRLWASESGV